MPITVAPASASARGKWRWLEGKNGSTKTTFMPGMLAGRGHRPTSAQADGAHGGKGYVSRMAVAGFVAPYLLAATMRFVEAAATVPGTELALISCEPEERVPPGLRRRLAAHWRIDDPFDAGQIAAAAEALGRHVGKVQRLLAVLEQLQVPLAQVRERLGIAGMDP